MKNEKGCHEGELHVQWFEQYKINTTRHGQPLTKFSSQTFFGSKRGLELGHPSCLGSPPPPPPPVHAHVHAGQGVVQYRIVRLPV